MPKPRSTAWQTAVTMLCEPGKPMLTLMDDEELAQRRHRRAPRPS